jgi:hypothetical protein
VGAPIGLLQGTLLGLLVHLLLLGLRN